LRNTILYIILTTLLSCSTKVEDSDKKTPINTKREIVDSSLATENKQIIIDIDSLLLDKDIVWLTCTAKKISMMKGLLIFSPTNTNIKDSIGVFHCLTERRQPNIINNDTIYSGTWPTIGREYLVGLRKSNGHISLIGEIKKDSYYIWNPCAYEGTTIFKTKQIDRILSHRFFYKSNDGYSYFRDRIAIKTIVF
jgi:hypothetical protein